MNTDKQTLIAEIERLTEQIKPLADKRSELIAQVQQIEVEALQNSLGEPRVNVGDVLKVTGDLYSDFSKRHWSYKALSRYGIGQEITITAFSIYKTLLIATIENKHGDSTAISYQLLQFVKLAMESVK